MILLRFPLFWTRAAKLSQMASVVPSLDVENMKGPFRKECAFQSLCVELGQ